LNGKIKKKYPINIRIQNKIIKFKRIRINFEKIKKNQDYEFKDNIENKLKFDKSIKNQNLKSKH
jgi:hypothetical protein